MFEEWPGRRARNTLVRFAAGGAAPGGFLARWVEVWAGARPLVAGPPAWATLSLAPPGDQPAYHLLGALVAANVDLTSLPVTGRRGFPVPPSAPVRESRRPRRRPGAGVAAVATDARSIPSGRLAALGGAAAPRLAGEPSTRRARLPVSPATRAGRRAPVDLPAADAAIRRLVEWLAPPDVLERAAAPAAPLTWLRLRPSTPPPPPASRSRHPAPDPARGDDRSVAVAAPDAPEGVAPGAPAPPGAGAPSVATAIARQLDTIVADAPLAPGLLDLLARPSARAPASPGGGAASRAGLPAAPAGRAATRGELPSAPAGAGSAPAAPPVAMGGRRPRPATGAALLRRLVAEWPDPAAGAAPARRPPVPAAPAVEPAVQNTFNVTVHAPGGFEDEAAMIERLTQLLVDQARRHGIDVG